MVISTKNTWPRGQQTSRYTPSWFAVASVPTWPCRYTMICACPVNDVTQDTSRPAPSPQGQPKCSTREISIARLLLECKSFAGIEQGHDVAGEMPGRPGVNQ